MVSRSSSVGYTTTGSTADLTLVQKTTIHLAQGGQDTEAVDEEAGSQSSVSKHINREAKGRKRWARNRDNCTLERTVDQNPLVIVGEIHRADGSGSQSFESHHADV